MTALVLFIANFALVCLLGLQQINVERRSMLAAACTSMWINAALLLQFKVLPGPTNLIDAAAFILAGTFGIVASMWLHPVLVRWFERRAPPLSGPDESEWDRLAEMQRLATELADDVGRSDIESYCSFEKMGRHTWYDTTSGGAQGIEVVTGIEKAARYLDLRGQLVRHPTQKHLVRIDA